jgi:hypothetical protein
LSAGCTIYTPDIHGSLNDEILAAEDDSHAWIISTTDLFLSHHTDGAIISNTLMRTFIMMLIIYLENVENGILWNNIILYLWRTPVQVRNILYKTITKTIKQKSNKN